MAIVADRAFVPGPNAITAPRRIQDVCRDFDPPFGPVTAKKFPPYVFSQRGGALVHAVDRVEIHWWLIAGSGDIYVRTDKPKMVAVTRCNYVFHLEPGRSRTCKVPSRDALLCGRCHGQPATFGPDGEAQAHGVSFQEARTRVGCIEHEYAAEERQD